MLTMTDKAVTVDTYVSTLLEILGQRPSEAQDGLLRADVSTLLEILAEGFSSGSRLTPIPVSTLLEILGADVLELYRRHIARFNPS